MSGIDGRRSKQPKQQLHELNEWQAKADESLEYMSEASENDFYEPIQPPSELS